MIKQCIEILCTQKKNKKDKYMKMIQEKRLLVIPNNSYEHFSDIKVNMNDL